MKRSAPGAWLAALALAAVSWIAMGAGVPDDDDAGQRIYRDGMLPGGQPLIARTRHGVTLSGREAACTNCHRRSGFGTVEGRQVVRPLPPLFDRAWMERSSLRARPVGGGRPDARYDLETFTRALRSGVDAAGRKLDALMPSYDIDDASVAALMGYIARLKPGATPGVTSHAVRLATVVTPDADPARAAAMVAVLRAFVADRNGGSRQESRRRAAGSDWMYQAHRTWELEVWKLQGAPGTWTEQLEARQRERPAFALVSGMGGDDWRPVHAFCERSRLPCVLPHAGVATGPGDFYAVYYTAGPRFEGAVLASHLRHSAAPVIQVYREHGGAGEAARALRAAMPHGAVTDVALADDASFAAAMQAVARAGAGHELVLWLRPDDLAPLRSDAALVASATHIHLSASLSAPQALDLPEEVRARVRLVHVHELPRAREPRFARVRAWLAARGLAAGDEAVLADTLFAATVTGDALFHMGAAVSPELLVERIEHMAGRMPNTSAYPEIGLAPGQRHASKGGFITRLDDRHGLVAASGWIVP